MKIPRLSPLAILNTIINLEEINIQINSIIINLIHQPEVVGADHLPNLWSINISKILLKPVLHNLPITMEALCDTVIVIILCPSHPIFKKLPIMAEIIQLHLFPVAREELPVPIVMMTKSFISED